MSQSLQSGYEYVCSFDAAIANPPDDAADEVKASFAAAYERALSTGNWSEVVQPDKHPKVYRVRAIPGSTMRRVLKDFGGSIDIEVFMVAAQLGIREISGWDKAPPMRWTTHERWGEMHTDSVIDFLDSQNRDIVNEVGRYILNKSIATDPKS